MIDNILSPTWRWDRAQEIYSGNQSLAKDEDTFILMAVAYLKSSNPTANNIVDKAFELFKSNSPIKSIVEALIIGNASQEDMGAATGLPIDVCMTYEKLFCDLRPHLEASGLMYSYIFDKTGKDRMWAMVGYYMGYPMLLKMWRNGKLEQKELKEFREVLRLLMLQKALMAVSTEEGININDVIQMLAKLEPQQITLSGNWTSPLDTADVNLHVTQVNEATDD